MEDGGESVLQTTGTGPGTLTFCDMGSLPSSPPWRG